VLSYEALADGVSADDLLGPLLASVPQPQIPVGERRTRSGDPWSARQS
jgi:MoxR-like ATPase